MKRIMAVVLGGALALVGGTAGVLDAATTTTNLAVTASVAATCTVSATGVSFGNFTGLGLTANGSLSVNCVSGAAYTVALAAGNNLRGGVRRMAGGGQISSNTGSTRMLR